MKLIKTTYEPIGTKPFKGDILITDPCYIIPDDKDDDWNDLKSLGLTTFLISDTFYGDWGCHVFDTNTKEPIGQFCADSGTCAVMLWEEVLKYNPNIEKWVKEHPWCATVLRDFEGDVIFEKECAEFVYEEEDEVRFSHCKAGDKWEDAVLAIRGTGNINFICKQTSL